MLLISLSLIPNSLLISFKVSSLLRLMNWMARRVILIACVIESDSFWIFRRLVAKPPLGTPLRSFIMNNSRNPSLTADLLYGGDSKVPSIFPPCRDASLTPLPPNETIFTSTSGATPYLFRNRRSDTSLTLLTPATPKIFPLRSSARSNFRTNDKNLIGRRTAYHHVPDRHAAQGCNRRNVAGGREIEIAGDHRLNRRNAGRDHNQFEIEALLLVEPLAQRYHLRKRAHAPSRYSDPKLLRFLRLLSRSDADEKHPRR